MAPHRSATITAVLNISSSGDNTVISAPSSGPLNIYCIVFTVTGATNITFKDSVGGTLSGAYVLTQNGSAFTFPMSDEPWYQIQPGGNFVINSSNAVTVSGNIWFTNG